ncbi:unnamed protein product [Miscanthus lutarioriparius]|uniref:Gnk2-homologous domain-containing protein n=1 Tax=Miscanthus lutarioriparius TaxID=422564 RepID=A0A811RXR4_9POAL|nr:unnamed protein product [Miscanthus lutarioriparius]
MHGLLPILLLCSSLLATTANADNPTAESCPSDTNYTRGSSFQAILDALLSSLPATAAAAPTGFATNTTGTSPDQAAYGLAQCRADVIDTSGKCAGQKKAVLVYDNCLLRLSDERFFGAVDMSPVAYLSNSQNATQPEQFAPRLGVLMSNLTKKAALESPRMDLTADDCNRCLVNAVSSIPSCCSGMKGGQLIYASCSIRFEVEPFYNIQAAEAVMSPVPAPGGGFVNGSDHSGPGSDGSNQTVRTALLVSIPVAVALLVLLLVVAYLCNRNRKPHKHVQIASIRHATKRAGDCSEEVVCNFAARTDGDEERGFPVGEAPAQELGLEAVEPWERATAAGGVPRGLEEGRRAQEMLRCIHVGLLCVQEDPHLRRSMASVVVMLNSRSITLPAPNAPAFAMPGRGLTVTADADAPVTGTDRQGARAVAAGRGQSMSINDASLTDLEPR